MASPILVAHRGYAARHPENTLAALAAALEAGAPCVEIDVQLTKDRVPVLFHDRTLDRMCGVGGAVRERTFDELRALACAERGRFGDRFAEERIASLAGFVDLLLRHPRAFAFVEIKRAALEAFGIDEVLARVLPELEPLRGRCALISFSLDALASVRAASDWPVGAVFDTWDETRVPTLALLDPEFVFVDVDGLPRDGALACGRAKLAVYEVIDPALARALAARGVAYVETFQIAEMLAALASGDGHA